MPEVTAVKTAESNEADGTWHMAEGAGGCFRAPTEDDAVAAERVDTAWSNWRIERELVGDGDDELCPECFPFEE